MENERGGQEVIRVISFVGELVDVLDNVSLGPGPAALSAVKFIGHGLVWHGCHPHFFLFGVVSQKLMI